MIINYKYFPYFLFFLLPLHTSSVHCFSSDAAQDYLQSLASSLPDTNTAHVRSLSGFSLSEKRIHEILFALQSELLYNSSVASPHYTNMIRDLEVYKGIGRSSENFIKHIDHTKTALGKHYLVTHFTNPYNDTHNQEQALFHAGIKALVYSPTLYNDIRTSLIEFHKHENILFAFFDEQSAAVNSKLLQRLYFSLGWFKHLNQNKYALDCLHAINTLSIAMRLFPVGFIGNNIMQAYAGAFQDYKDGISPRITLQTAITHGLKHGILNGFHPYPFKLKAFAHQSNNKSLSHATPLPISLGDFFYQIDHTFFPEHNRWFRNGIKAYLAIYHYLNIWQYFYGARLAWDEARLSHELITYLYSQLHSIGTLITLAQKITACIADQPLLCQTQAYKHLIKFTHKTISPDLLHIINSLFSSSCTTAPAHISRVGTILATYQKFQTVKHELLNILSVGIGELDAMAAMTELYTTSYHQNAQYCFVEFIERKQPYIYFKDSWNPFISPDKAVSNTITLGNDTHGYHMIITGANTGGKSTIAQSIALNILLANFAGIAAAKSATITKFSHIFTYYHITADISQGASLFYASIARLREITEALKKTRSHEFALILLDEPVRGTTPEKEERIARNHMLQLIAYSNSMLITTTHLHGLTHLEDTTQGAFVNYHVDAFIHDSPAGKSIMRPFKLERGASQQNIALDLIDIENQKYQLNDYVPTDE